MWKTSLLLCVALTGCHSSMDDMGSMRSYVDDTRRETNRHVEAARAATTMQHMREEMAVHRMGMMPMMMDMDGTMESMMGHCDGSGLGDMRAMHGQLADEMTHHLAIMDASIELGAARAEVEHHAATMQSMMDGMDGAMGHMSCR